MTDTTLDRAIRLVLDLFPPGPVDEADIEQNCDDILMIFSARGDVLPDRDTLIKEIQARVIIWQDGSTGLEDNTGHEAWLPERRTEIHWKFRDRYRRYLESEELLPPTVVNRMDESTDRVLSKIENPLRAGAWDRRGLVVGQVQSGKTGHYTGLVCKAADSGYRLIVVLAGLHNSLRSQTQLRMDEGFLGFDTQNQQRSDDGLMTKIGAGAMTGAERIWVGSLTTSHEGGDFKKSVARNMNLPIIDMPVLLVVKKHTTILKNLINWITSVHGEKVTADSDDWIVRGLPMLVIDDEADNASMNTKDPETDPTETNKQIRILLKRFEQSAYVGYTATPFANIFASVATSETYGLDLFPRSFIESLKPPTNYLGPARVFGLQGQDDSGDVEPLNIFRTVEDYASWMPDKHKKDWDPRLFDLPESLRQSIQSFLLTSAARRARGQVTKHNSMLVHVTRFQDVQKKVHEQIADYMENLRRRLRYGDGHSRSAWEEFEELWENDYVPLSDGWESEVDEVSWQQVREQLSVAVEKTEIRTINGSSHDALEYYENRKTGLSVIAIGGDKLSRGLTLEGLSVSYYLRFSTMYDTLMQMGRWFGYRPGYEDLCRLYTIPDLFDSYREITAASEELRSEFDEMALRGATPEQYGLKIRMSPSGLLITARNKLLNAETVTLSFSGNGPETTTFDVSDEATKTNRNNLEYFLAELNSKVGPPEEGPELPGLVWRNVPGLVVARDFFAGYQAASTAYKSRPEFISAYIRDMVNEHEELTDWTVVLQSNQSSQMKEPIDIAGVKIRPFERKNINDSAEVATTRHYAIKRLLSPIHEMFDLTREQKDAAYAATVNRYEFQKSREMTRRTTPPDIASGPDIRAQRDCKNGLLLIYVIENSLPSMSEPMIGFVSSFPVSEHYVNSTYKVGAIWKQLALEPTDEDEDD